VIDMWFAKSSILIVLNLQGFFWWMYLTAFTSNMWFTIVLQANVSTWGFLVHKPTLEDYKDYEVL
jgi:hypothetical protein